MLCRWAIAMQEYDFNIVHCKDSTNTNADALSRLPPPSCALSVALPYYLLSELKEAQSLQIVVETVSDCRWCIVSNILP